MPDPLYVHLSEDTPVWLTASQAVRGFHALGGLRLDTHPAPLSAAAWRERFTRFLLALDYAGEDAASWWVRAWHLRVSFPAGEAAPRVSLWIGLTAPSDWQAESAVCDLCEELRYLLPPEVEAEPVGDAEAFREAWGAETPPMLAEVRPDERPPSEAEPSGHLARPFPRWGALQQVVLLCRRLEGPLSLHFTFLPVALRPAERAALQEPQGWQNGLFFVRQTLGGGSAHLYLAAQALAAAQTHTGSRVFGRMSVVRPFSEAEWQAARYNWAWGGLRPWGGLSSEEAAARLPYLVSPALAAAILTPWCIL